MTAETALVVAYGIVWVILFGLVLRCGLAIRGLRQDAMELRRRLSALPEVGARDS